MARRPGRVPQAATLREAARELTDAEIGAVVVEGSGGTVGLISVRDVLPVLVRSRW
jgi:CBS domain-containing protein